VGAAGGGAGAAQEEGKICIELGKKDSLQISYGNQALILKAWGRLEEALALLKKQEEICIELGNKDSLAITYGNQGAILQDQGKLEEAVQLYKKKETLSLGLGKRDNLGYCYWAWGLLARAQADRKTEREKLEQALAIFTELKMPRERDEVQKELERVDSG
jgi:tetratricopeptide (TPR) repeat protein